MALAPLLQQLGLDAQSAARAKGLRLRLRIPPSSLWVHSDASLVYRILLNLVSNAIRYTEVGGVLVSARRVQAGRQVKLQVWDTGVGIAPEHQQAVFTEFFQVDNPGRDRRLGLGLGLNIVQRTALLLGLPLSLRSQPGRGTCITLLLPASDTSQIGATATPEPVIAPQDVLVGVRVLVVEDDSLSAQALVGLLQDWGMQVRLAPSGAQALRVVAQGWHPDLLVSDCRLPDTHGIALVQGLRRQLGESLRACLISGDTDPGVLAQAQLRELTLLHKPVRPAKLRALLSRLLQTQRTTGTLP
jgi:CheY-like chemotaxis protein